MWNLNKTKSTEFIEKGVRLVVTINGVLAEGGFGGKWPKGTKFQLKINKY